MNESLDSFIEQQLETLASKHNVPNSLVPDIVHLMQEYPDLERYGRLTDLVSELSKIIENEQRAGRIEDE